MDLLREYAAGAGFPVELMYLCFFQIEHTIYGLAAQKKQLYKYQDSRIETVELTRDYRKIVPDLAGYEYFAYTQTNPGNEVHIYHLDSYFKEYDSIRLKKYDRSCHPVDLCYDGKQEYLFLVYSETILKYNLNGDFLGCFLSAPPETVYCAMCTYGESVFVAYRKKGCLYVAQYRKDGRYKERISLGNEYEIYGIQVIKDKPANDKEQEILKLYLTKNKSIPLFLELKFHASAQPDSINITLIRGEHIGEATCHIKHTGHT